MSATANDIDVGMVYDTLNEKAKAEVSFADYERWMNANGKTIPLAERGQLECLFYLMSQRKK